MGVGDGHDVRAHLVNREMHHDLACAFATAGNFTAGHVADDEIFDGHAALADAGGGAQDPVSIEADADVAVVGGDPAFVEHEAANLDDVLAEFVFFLTH